MHASSSLQFECMHVQNLQHAQQAQHVRWVRGGAEWRLGAGPTWGGCTATGERVEAGRGGFKPAMAAVEAHAGAVARVGR